MSEALMDKLRNCIPPKAIVFREGRKSVINTTELVPGDIVEISVGCRIPADLVLIKTNEMNVINDTITGESD